MIGAICYIYVSCCVKMGYWLINWLKKSLNSLLPFNWPNNVHLL